MDQEYYRPQDVETEAQADWEEHCCFRATEDPARRKFYCLSMFPYPSGQLHMGHVRNYAIGDVIARYQRMQGHNVLQPMGWDAFGLPAENAAIQNRVPPAKWTRENIGYMRVQLRRLGFSYDWDRELTTCDPEYYRWEQWLFIRLFRKGLVYRKTAPVNWCPHDMTVLANEQVINGCCWRCDTPVERREIAQWFMKITDYAEELLGELETMEGWPEKVRIMQHNWIGRSEGVELEFSIPGHGDPLRVFTTRPDTLFGVTYVAVAPEHPLALQAAQDSPAVNDFIRECQRVGTSEAAIETMDKRGIDLGIRALHPVTREAVPVYAANFVLMSYGEGAVMAVPGHDQRDWEFAQAYGLPIRVVIVPPGYESNHAQLVAQGAFEDHGVLVESGEFSGLSSAQAFEKIAAWVEEHGRGRKRVNYRLRDWGVSRQRYWGAPIPIINCPTCGAVPVAEEDLPVVLPEDVVFEGLGSPIKKMPEFYQATCPQCGGAAERETDTFDTFMESSWYYARYACPDQDTVMLDERADFWLPVDQYIGGEEHAILHLLYARFYHKLLRDAGLVHSNEPFTRVLTQGMVLKDGVKMSKSKGNTVDPQDLVDRYGADTVRLFTISAAPPEQTLEWNDEAVEGAFRFLKRLWKLVAGADSLDVLRDKGQVPEIDQEALPARLQGLRAELHGLLVQASRDFARYKFNTVISAARMMVNQLQEVITIITDDTVDKPQQEAGRVLYCEGVGMVIRILSPVVPHVTHILWKIAGFPGTVLDSGWPETDPRALERDTIELVVQVNGKLRGRISVAAQSSREEIEAAAVGEPNVRRFTAGQEIRKIIIVPNKLVNIVAG